MGPNGHLDFRDKTNTLQYCDMTQYKNSVRLNFWEKT